MKQKKINFETRPIPGNGAKQITIEGQKSMKGGSEFVSAMPTKHVIKDGSKSKK